MRRVLNTIKNHRNWLNYFKFKYLSSGADHFLFKTNGGLDVDVPKRLLHTYKESFFDESYTKGFTHPLKLKENPIVVDVGANVGYFTLFMLSCYPKAKLYSYEPMPMNFKLLSKYRDENSSLDMNIFNMAVSAEVKTLTLHYDASDSFTTAATLYAKDDQPDKIEVPTTTLEEIMTNNNLDKIDFLKLDCEGSEYEILYDATTTILDRVNVIALETHVSDQSKHNTNDLNQFLKSRGFVTKVWHDLIWAQRV